jgi:hypothetical protein
VSQPRSVTAVRASVGTVSTMLLAVAVVVAGVLVGGSPAQAAGYPSWDDVTAARANESSKAAQISELQGLLTGLQTDAANAQSEAERLGALFQQAQDAADTGAAKLAELESQVAEQEAVADESERRAGQVSAQLARTGGGDVSTQIVATATSRSR